MTELSRVDGKAAVATAGLPVPAVPVLEVRDCRRSYEGGQIEALRGVSLKIERGDFLAITGPSGSGKSTLLQLLGGLDAPSSGEVLFEGSRLGTAIDLDTYRAKHVGFIFQAFHLMPTLRVIENVQIPMLAAGIPRSERVGRAEVLLQEMGMSHRLKQYPSQLSAGERQRVAIARALANDPALLLADEPTGNLDSANSCRIMDALTQIQIRRGMTMVIVTHENEIACAAPRHVRIRDGRVDGDISCVPEAAR